MKFHKAQIDKPPLCRHIPVTVLWKNRNMKAAFY